MNLFRPVLIRKYITNCVFIPQCGIEDLRSLRQCLRSAVETIVNIVPLQLFLKLANTSFTIDDEEFEASHLGVVLQMFNCQGQAKSRVMSSSSQDPGTCRSFQVRLRNP